MLVDLGGMTGILGQVGFLQSLLGNIKPITKKNPDIFSDYRIILFTFMYKRFPMSF